jgi:hypothetical protein
VLDHGVSELLSPTVHLVAPPFGLALELVGLLLLNLNLRQPLRMRNATVDFQVRFGFRVLVELRYSGS